MAIIISSLILLSVYPHTVFAQKSLITPDITVKTDKSSYIFGDTIVIYGTVKTVIQGDTINIQILDPYGNLIQTAQTSVLQDGSYADFVGITGSGWKSGGMYSVLVQYGSEVQTRTTFAFTATTTPISDTFQVQIPNNPQIFNVPYTIFGGSVMKMSVDTSSHSLTVSVSSVNYGTITLSLPRTLLDAKTSNGMDAPFTVLIDGTKTIAQKDQGTTNDRTLTIQFLQGTKDIQIIGTSVASENNSTINTSANSTTNQQPPAQITNMSKLVPAVPEFPFTALVLLVSISLLILVSRSRLKF